MPLAVLTRRSRSSTNLSRGFKTRWVVSQYASISGMNVHPRNCRQWLSVAVYLGLRSDADPITGLQMDGGNGNRLSGRMLWPSP